MLISLRFTTHTYTYTTPIHPHTSTDTSTTQPILDSLPIQFRCKVTVTNLSIIYNYQLKFLRYSNLINLLYQFYVLPFFSTYKILGY